MKKLYAPWRSSYTNMEEKPDRSFCVFCKLAQETKQDEANFVLKRNIYTFTMLNLYPYNGGHLLIAPYQHVDNLSLLNSDARAELMEEAHHAVVLLQDTVEPDGFNIGLNMGGFAAGGSIPEHIHFHVLPRWKGDTSFLPTLADTKPISENLPELYTCLKAALAKR